MLNDLRETNATTGDLSACIC